MDGNRPDLLVCSSGSYRVRCLLSSPHAPARRRVPRTRERPRALAAPGRPSRRRDIPNQLRLALVALPLTEGALRGLARSQDRPHRDRLALRGPARVFLPLGGANGAIHAGDPGAPRPTDGTGGVDRLLGTRPPDGTLRSAVRTPRGGSRPPPLADSDRTRADRRTRAGKHPAGAHGDPRAATGQHQVV